VRSLRLGFKINPKGRPAKYCKASCRVMAFEKAPKATRVPFADQVAMRVWQAMQAANLVPSGKPLPPMRKAESER